MELPQYAAFGEIIQAEQKKAMFTMGPQFPKIIKGVRSNMFH